MTANNKPSPLVVVIVMVKMMMMMMRFHSQVLLLEVVGAAAAAAVAHSFLPILALRLSKFDAPKDVLFSVWVEGIGGAVSGILISMYLCSLSASGWLYK